MYLTISGLPVPSKSLSSCHRAIFPAPSPNPSSTVNVDHIDSTCGGSLSDDNCHGGERSTEAFTEAAAEMIHQKSETRDRNPLLEFLSNLFGWLS